MAATITKTINIKVSPEKVWDFVSDLSRWKEWAVHNVIDVQSGGDGFWLMKGPRGTSKVKMNAHKALGILDHDFIDPAEGHWTVSARVVKGSDGAHFMVTFTKPGQISDEAFEAGMKQLDDELAVLKRVLEAAN